MEIIVLPGLKSLATHPSTFTHCRLALKTRRELGSLKGCTGKPGQPGPRSRWQDQACQTCPQPLACLEQGKATSLQTFLCNVGIKVSQPARSQC